MTQENTIKGYVYKITNNINDHWYIGSHIGTKPDYMGSGKILKLAIKKHGVENFTKEILFYTDTFQEDEEALLNELDAAGDKDSYNLHNGGTGGTLGLKHSEATKQKQRQAAKNRPPVSDETRKKQSAYKGEKHWAYGKTMREDHRKNISEANKGKIMSPESVEKMRKTLTGRTVPDEVRKKISENHSRHMLGKKHTEETKKKISESLTGQIISEETKQKLSKALTGRIFTEEHRMNLSKALSGENNPFYGKTFSDEHKKKISEANKGREFPPEFGEAVRQRMIGTKQEQTICKHCGLTGGKHSMTRYHMDNCKFKRKVINVKEDKKYFSVTDIVNIFSTSRSSVKNLIKAKAIYAEKITSPLNVDEWKIPVDKFIEKFAL